MNRVVATMSVSVCLGCEHFAAEAQFGGTWKLLCGKGHPFPESLRPATAADVEGAEAGDPSVLAFGRRQVFAAWCPRFDDHAKLDMLREL